MRAQRLRGAVGHVGEEGGEELGEEGRCCCGEGEELGSVVAAVAEEAEG